jgi:hypothetical protein
MLRSTILTLVLLTTI